MSDEKIDFLTTGVHFKRKPAKMGDRYVFNIPKNYIDNGLIDPNEEYIVYLGIVKEKKEK